jgi:hypothetical protein
MKKRVLRSCRTLAVLFCCLAAATPAWAGYGYSWQKLDVYLKGVNRYGCLTWYGGQYASFCALINTRSGEFVGSTTGKVCNESRCLQLYCNVNLFNNSVPEARSSGSQYYYFVNVKYSLYAVAGSGWASYVALGRLSEYD